jgi:hypothetical protein
MRKGPCSSDCLQFFPIFFQRLRNRCTFLARRTHRSLKSASFPAYFRPRLFQGVTIGHARSKERPQTRLPALITALLVVALVHAR